MSYFHEVSLCCIQLAPPRVTNHRAHVQLTSATLFAPRIELVPHLSLIEATARVSVSPSVSLRVPFFHGDTQKCTGNRFSPQAKYDTQATCAASGLQRKVPFLFTLAQNFTLFVSCHNAVQRQIRQHTCLFFHASARTSLLPCTCDLSNQIHQQRANQC